MEIVPTLIAPPKRLASKPASSRAAKTPKLLCSHMTTVQQSHAGKVSALLEEISETSAVVSLECPLRVSSAVRIDCGTCELRGKVAGCKLSPLGYLAEVELNPDEPWIPAEFKPDRLFNPESMVCTRPGCSSDCTNDSCVSARKV